VYLPRFPFLIVVSLSLLKQLAKGYVLRGQGQSIASTVSIGAGQTILFNPSTKFQPGHSSTTMFSLNAGATLKGGWFDVSNQASFSGRVVAFTGNYWDVFAVGVAGMHTVLSNVKITGVNGSSPYPHRRNQKGRRSRHGNGSVNLQTV
jgi:hypothetical protein